MSDSTTGLTVLALTGENVKRVKAVRIQPTSATGVVKIAGRNGQGKSSTLDLIMLALGGAKHQPTLPLRKGTKSAKDVVELQDLAGQPVYRITRTWTEKDSYLTVERIGTGKVARPRELMDAMIGAGLGFDPGEFIRLKPKQQVETLLSVVPLEVDPRTLDADRKTAYEDRTAVNREVKQLEGQLAALLEPDGSVPDTEISVADLTAEYQRRTTVREANKQQREALEIAYTKHALANAEVVRLENALTAARADLVARHEEVMKIKDATEALVDPDVDAIAEQMRTAESTNVQVRLKRQRVTVVRELEERRDVVGALTDAITAIDARKARLLEEAPFPIPGLGFEEIGGEPVVTFRGVPLADAAESERMLVGMAIAMALNPQVRVILIREASLLDAETLTAVEQLAKERAYQVWTEIVGEGDSDSFVIADGGVISGPTVATPAPTPETALPW